MSEGKNKGRQKEKMPPEGPNSFPSSRGGHPARKHPEPHPDQKKETGSGKQRGEDAGAQSGECRDTEHREHPNSESGSDSNTGRGPETGE